MAINYAGLRHTADRLLRDNGAPYTLQRGGGVQVIKGVEVAVPRENHRLTGVITRYTTGEIDGTLIQQGDIKMFATAETEIRQGDHLLIEGKAHRVIQVTPVKPATLLLCYQLQLRA
ncbi:hypothetical protein SK355_09500 [Candidatus Fukatsuia symbiotica]|uniref:Phage protein n=1 Tax=Candidatus Fukatsuia symbiotica TaxID=1878942 RepID=A0A2U8I3E0_9GAMM|nr:hypothetical protein [Candidatus Fukatsuia symbiotica]AWK13636.1 hypothetical protein CCS41_02625 [Candidatus Fukatsuia symbiotica]MEA9445453.1 hypothetical protein [Candidatus Fukatsuia symbiotica]